MSSAAGDRAGEVDGEGRPTDDASLQAMLEELASRAWELEAPWDESGIGGGGAVRVDRLLVRVARGHGAIDVALGECLAALGNGDRTLRLVFAGLGDYAREVLGMAPRTALALARLARELQDRPLLREAVRAGRVTPRLAQELLPLARGPAEAEWVARASSMTVREAREAARRRGVPDPLEDDGFERVEFPADAACRERLDEALSLAGEVLGPTAPAWQRLEAICQEYLGAHPVMGEVGAGMPVPSVEPRGECGTESERRQDGLERALEAETRRWERLLAPGPVVAPGGAGEGDVHAIDARARELAGMRDGWDDLVGHLGLLVQVFRLWRHLGFASFKHYCVERLGMAERTVAQRVWLERRMHDLPGLREAKRQGRVSYEKARLVAGVAVPRDVETWVARAERVTCVEFRRMVEAGEKAQMCARGRVSILAPRRVAALFDDACAAVIRTEGRWLRPEECLSRLCDHFLRAWEGLRERRRTPQRRAIERDGGLCQVPGCSRAAVHAHHVTWRSRGGGDEEENLVSLCAGHHLHGVHRGYVRVSGQAPDGLRWEIGEERRPAGS
ncbi:MAG: HNH endonuclease signature motif containing protein [Anaeromyxobacteraceae bacterium]